MSISRPFRWFFQRSKPVVVGTLVGVVSAVLGLGAVFAYLTIYASGSGTGSTGALQQPTQALTFTVQPITMPSYGGSSNVYFSAVNPSSNPVQINNVTAQITGVTNVAAGKTCLASWFQIDPQLSSLAAAANGAGAAPELELGTVPNNVPFTIPAGQSISDFDNSYTGPGNAGGADAAHPFRLYFPTDTADNQTGCVGASLTVSLAAS